MKCLYSFLKAGFLKVMSIQVLAIVCVCVSNVYNMLYLKWREILEQIEEQGAFPDF